MSNDRRLEVSVSDTAGRPIRAGRGLSAWLSRAAPGGARGTVAVALASDRHLRELNRRYRGQDRVTDVLSFPSAASLTPARAAAARTHRPDPCFLGDIVIARGQARRQAAAEGHSEQVELRVLALHGLLHLLGYDHEADSGEMARVERRLRRKGGLPEGLIERVG